MLCTGVEHCKYKVQVDVFAIPTLQTVGDIIATPILQASQKFVFKVVNPTSGGPLSKWAHFSTSETTYVSSSPEPLASDLPAALGPDIAVYPCDFNNHGASYHTLIKDANAPSAVSIRLNSFCRTRNL